MPTFHAFTPLTQYLRREFLGNFDVNWYCSELNNKAYLPFGSYIMLKSTQSFWYPVLEHRHHRFDPIGLADDLPDTGLSSDEHACYKYLLEHWARFEDLWFNKNGKRLPIVGFNQDPIDRQYHERLAKQLGAKCFKARHSYWYEMHWDDFFLTLKKGEYPAFHLVKEPQTAEELRCAIGIYRQIADKIELYERMTNSIS